MEILFIVGSLRKGSFNRQIADTAMKDLEGKAEVHFLDWKGLPVLDADEIYPFGEQAEIVRNAIHEADALWIFDPEYNGNIPGGLKNLLDTASLSYKPDNLASGTPIMGKPVCISSAAGKMAGAGSRKALTAMLNFLGCKVCPEQTGFALPQSAFRTGIWEMTAEDKEKIAQQARIFLAFIQEQK